jgi:hypothetical protein
MLHKYYVYVIVFFMALMTWLDLIVQIIYPAHLLRLH